MIMHIHTFDTFRTTAPNLANQHFVYERPEDDESELHWRDKLLLLVGGND